VTSRRNFVLAVLPAAALSAAAARSASAQQPVRLQETDAAAVALGYRHDATKVDKAKSPTFAPGRICGNCGLFAAKGNEEWAPCAAVGNRLVNAKGWCAAWVKKS
jgi:hypothetical protein